MGTYTSSCCPKIDSLKDFNSVTSLYLVSSIFHNFGPAQRKVFSSCLVVWKLGISKHFIFLTLNNYWADPPLYLLMQIKCNNSVTRLFVQATRQPLFRPQYYFKYHCFHPSRLTSAFFQIGSPSMGMHGSKSIRPNRANRPFLANRSSEPSKFLSCDYDLHSSLKNK